MKCFFKWKCMCREIGCIHLVDKCLILFMIVLLVQSAYGLFAHGDGMAQPNEIDVIVRTAAASIFGYFLSANFIRRDAEKKELGGKRWIWKGERNLPRRKMDITLEMEAFRFWQHRGLDCFV